MGMVYYVMELLDGLDLHKLVNKYGPQPVESFAGTAHYAAPEMAEGLIHKIDGRSDIYALGCVAFWLLTGRPIFEAETVMKLLVKHIHDEPAPPSRPFRCGWQTPSSGSCGAGAHA